MDIIKPLFPITGRKIILTIALLMLLLSGGDTEASQQGQGSDRIDSLINKSYQLFDYGFADSLEIISNDILSSPSSLLTDEQRAKGILIGAWSLHMRDRFCEAIDGYNNYLALLEDAGIHPYNKYMILLNIARIYGHLGEIENSRICFLQAWKEMDTSNPAQLADYYEALTYFFDIHNLHKSGLEFSRLSLQYHTAEPDSAGMASSLYSIAYFHNAMGQNDQALEMLAKCGDLATQIGDEFLTWKVKACSGICYLEKKEYEKGLQYLQEAEPLGKKFGKQLCCGNTAYQALALIKTGRENEALHYAGLAATQLPEITDLLDKCNVLEALYQVYEHIGSDSLALATYKQWKSAEDLLTTENYETKLAQLEVDQEVNSLLLLVRSQEEKLVTSQEIKKKLTYILYSVSCVLLVCLGIWWRHLKKLKFYKEAASEFLKLSQTKQSVIGRSIEHFVMKHLQDPLYGVDSLAKDMGTSRRNLSRMIKSESGTTPAQLIRAIKLREAKVLLAGNDYNISEVAYMAGFSDPGYFIKVFRRTEGITPNQWRLSMSQKKLAYQKE